jgi:putative heme iron utilization protein
MRKPQTVQPKEIPTPEILPRAASRHARKLMRGSRSAALATILDGHPYSSLVTVAFDLDCSPLLLLSDLAGHTQNIFTDARVSLLFEEASHLSNPQSGPRITAQGKIKVTDNPFLAERFITRHPSAQLYSGFKDFNFYRVEMDQLYFIGGFAEALWLSKDDFEVNQNSAIALAECEADVLSHMNAGHSETISLYANNLLGKPGKAWEMIGIDPDGCDLKQKNSYLRLSFEEPVFDAASCRVALIKLATEARDKALDLCQNIYGWETYP